MASNWMNRPGEEIAHSLAQNKKFRFFFRCDPSTEMTPEALQNSSEDIAHCKVCEGILVQETIDALKG